MPLNKQEIKQLEKFSKFNIPQEQETVLLEKIGSILEWIAQLQKLDIHNAEPLISINQEQARLRNDEIITTNTTDHILSNAKKTKDNMFVVPNVVE